MLLLQVYFLGNLAWDTPKFLFLSYSSVFQSHISNIQLSVWFLHLELQLQLKATGPKQSHGPQIHNISFFNVPSLINYILKHPISQAWELGIIILSLS